MYFCPNTPALRRDKVLEVLGVDSTSTHKNYFELSYLILRSKRQIFAYIHDRIACKIKGWKEKLLSQGKREVLIKGVAQAILTYVMSCFKLPQSLLEDLSWDLAVYWWGSSGKKRKIH